MNMETMPAPPRSTANPAPVRPANSLRRTTSIDVSWPDGTDQPRLFIGRVRDYRTESPDQPGTELDHAVNGDERGNRKRITEQRQADPLLLLSHRLEQRQSVERRPVHNPHRTIHAGCE